jgi:hypothetical protein
MKVSNKELQPNTVSCGFSHTCAINKHGQLLIWGDNSIQQLFFESIQKEDKKHKDPIMKLIKTPTYIELLYEIKDPRVMQKLDEVQRPGKDKSADLAYSEDGLRNGIKYDILKRKTNKSI